MRKREEGFSEVARKAFINFAWTTGSWTVFLLFLLAKSTNVSFYSGRSFGVRNDGADTDTDEESSESDGDGEVGFWPHAMRRPRSNKRVNPEKSLVQVCQLSRLRL